MLKAEQVLQGRYQLKQKLGHNAGRQTWLAADLQTPSNQFVTIKIISFNVDFEWDNLKLFEREAQVLKQLNHSQIPKYVDYFCVDDKSCCFALVQEYIPGDSLKELLPKKFTEQEVKEIAAQVLNILVYLHELNPTVLHRDIKPSNLILAAPVQKAGDNERGEDGQIYLIDFGAVQDQAASEGATFTVVGTYGYAPLEQFGGRAVPASDLYALGATLIHLLTGTAPADLPVRNLQIQFSDGTTPITSWLQKLVEPAVERRFSTARIALAALNNPTEIELFETSVIVNNSGQGKLFDLSIPVPEEIKGWNWGAFLAAPLWACTNRVGIGFLALLPVGGFWMAIALGAKGNEWAWKSRRWESIEQFKEHQRRWAIAGIILGISLNLISSHIALLLLISNLF